jgi:DNA-binding IclR family transcriptional regulator
MKKHSDKPLSRAPVIRAVPTASRTVRILRYLARSSEPAGVNKIAVALGIVPSSCLHILRVLTEEGLVAVDSSTRRYRMGIGILPLARAFINNRDLSLTVQPILDKMARRHGVTFALVERSGPSRVVASAVAEGTEMYGIKVSVGASAPAFASASGRCIAAYSKLGRAQLETRFANLPWQNAPSFARWLADLETVRAEGYAVDAGCYVRGVSIVAVPILDSDGDVRCCVTWTALKDQLSPARFEALLSDAKSAADQIGPTLL